MFLVDLLLVRRLPSSCANTGKRLVKSPKVYVRDSGLVQALLGIPDHNALAVLYPGEDRYPVAEGVEVIGLKAALVELAATAPAQGAS